MTRLGIIPLTALTLSSWLGSNWNLLEPQRMDERTLKAKVGLIEGRCCRPGRRWGCDPANFKQSGCTRIGAALNCERRNWATMVCSKAECIHSNPEHACEINIRTVRHNRCRPTGNATTVGCPEEHWQCEVLMRRYTNPGNPASDVIVCDMDVSTPCAANYSQCD